MARMMGSACLKQGILLGRVLMGLCFYCNNFVNFKHTSYFSITSHITDQRYPGIRNPEKSFAYTGLKFSHFINLKSKYTRNTNKLNFFQ